MRIRVSESYSVELAPRIRRETDGEVTSFWQDNEEVLLQLSSKRRVHGEQVSAAVRLQERTAGEDVGHVQTVDLKVESPDGAGAVFTDEEGWSWLYYYLVWPDLTIFATVCHPDQGELTTSWAAKAIESIKREDT